MHRDLVTQPWDNHHRMNARDPRHGFVGGFLHCDDLAAPREPVGGDHCDRATSLESDGDGLRAVAREDREKDRTQLATREEGDNGLGQHREEQPDRIALRTPPAARPYASASV